MEQYGRFYLHFLITANHGTTVRKNSNVKIQKTMTACYYFWTGTVNFVG